MFRLALYNLVTYHKSKLISVDVFFKLFLMHPYGTLHVVDGSAEKSEPSCRKENLKPS